MTKAAHELEVALRTVDGVPVASVRGELDLDTMDRFERGLRPVREGEGPAVLDLEGVPFMDSSGLHVVVALWRALRGEGRTLAVSCRPDGVRKLFELTALDGVLPLYDDATAAVRAVGGGGRGVSAPAS
ncbi:MAG: STAS domain-containing protein [Thermoleophilaceae bacterium]